MERLNKLAAGDISAANTGNGILIVFDVTSDHRRYSFNGQPVTQSPIDEIYPAIKIEIEYVEEGL